MAYKYITYKLIQISPQDGRVRVEQRLRERDPHPAGHGDEHAPQRRATSGLQRRDRDPRLRVLPARQPQEVHHRAPIPLCGRARRCLRQLQQLKQGVCLPRGEVSL